MFLFMLMVFSGIHHVGLLCFLVLHYKTDTERVSLPIYLLELILLPGNIEQEHSLSYWFGLAQFGSVLPGLKAPLTQLALLLVLPWNMRLQHILTWFDSVWLGLAWH